MNLSQTKTVDRSASREQQLREAVLLTFCDPPSSECTRLLKLSQLDWKLLLHWLDTSGLALYFLDRVRELGFLRSEHPGSTEEGSQCDFAQPYCAVRKKVPSSPEQNWIHGDQLFTLW